MSWFKSGTKDAPADAEASKDSGGDLSLTAMEEEEAKMAAMIAGVGGGGFSSKETLAAEAELAALLGGDAGAVGGPSCGSAEDELASLISQAAGGGSSGGLSEEEELMLMMGGQSEAKNLQNQVDLLVPSPPTRTPWVLPEDHGGLVDALEALGVEKSLAQTAAKDAAKRRDMAAMKKAKAAFDLAKGRQLAVTKKLEDFEAEARALVREDPPAAVPVVESVATAAPVVDLLAPTPTQSPQPHSDALRALLGGQAGQEEGNKEASDDEGMCTEDELAELDALAELDEDLAGLPTPMATTAHPDPFRDAEEAQAAIDARATLWLTEAAWEHAERLHGLKAAAMKVILGRIKKIKKSGNSTAVATLVKEARVPRQEYEAAKRHAAELARDLGASRDEFERACGSVAGGKAVMAATLREVMEGAADQISVLENEALEARKQAGALATSGDKRAALAALRRAKAALRLVDCARADVASLRAAGRVIAPPSGPGGDLQRPVCVEGGKTVSLSSPSPLPVSTTTPTPGALLVTGGPPPPIASPQPEVGVPTGSKLERIYLLLIQRTQEAEGKLMVDAVSARASGNQKLATQLSLEASKARDAAESLQGKMKESPPLLPLYKSRKISYAVVPTNVDVPAGILRVTAGEISGAAGFSGYLSLSYHTPEGVKKHKGSVVALSPAGTAAEFSGDVDLPRTRPSQRVLQIRKFELSLWETRGFLKSDICRGSAVFNVSELLSRSTVTKHLQIVNKRKDSGIRVGVVVSVRTPYRVKKEDAARLVKTMDVTGYNVAAAKLLEVAPPTPTVSVAASPSPVAPAQTPAPTSSTKPNLKPQAAAAKPQKVVWRDEIQTMISSEVLDAERKRLEALGGVASGPEVALALERVETQYQALINAVQTGRLSVEEYVGMLQDRVQADTEDAKAFAKKGDRGAAERAVRRVKIMKGELSELV